MSLGSPLRAWISLRLLAEARARRKVVFMERRSKATVEIGSKGGFRRASSTTNRSQRGMRRGDWASRRATPLEISLRRKSFSKEGPPSWRRVVQMADLYPRMELAESLREEDRWDRKFPIWILEGESWGTELTEHQETHLTQR